MKVRGRGRLAMRFSCPACHGRAAATLTSANLASLKLPGDMHDRVVRPPVASLALPCDAVRHKPKTFLVWLPVNHKQTTKAQQLVNANKLRSRLRRMFCPGVAAGWVPMPAAESPRWAIDVRPMPRVTTTSLRRTTEHEALHNVSHSGISSGPVS